MRVVLSEAMLVVVVVSGQADACRGPLKTGGSMNGVTLRDHLGSRVTPRQSFLLSFLNSGQTFTT